MPRLIVMNEQVGLDFRFSRAISVGRHISNGLPLPDAEISRRHAQIFPKGDGFLISDLGSRNGVFVNGTRCTDHPLRPGDEIALGNTLLFFDPASPEAAKDDVSAHGRAILKRLPNHSRFEETTVTNFSATEMNALVADWLAQRESAPLLPYALRSDFLRFALALDRESNRGDLARQGLDFLEEIVGGKRHALLVTDEKKHHLEVLCAASADSETDAVDLDKDVLRVVLHAERAVYSENCATDYRYQHLTREDEPYRVGSFAAAPIFCHERYYGFLYLDQPMDGPTYDFKSLVQVHITAALLGKAFHWLSVGRTRKVRA